jgi:hypothetical protein
MRSVSSFMVSFFKVSWGDTAATNWPIGRIIADDECGAVGGKIVGKGNMYSEKTCPSANLSTTNPT